ncbi:MAG: right-handed parallel beta-helix repeat-containing protein [Candidatus Hatepunaea meridiana]|nr:right-handed parallel beta-helix repeat-containing protein [Candidatus Hatepunaea meridiana]
MKAIRLIVRLSFLLILCIVPGLNADILNVPDDYETIQAALDEASNQDTILIADGEYTGEDNVNLDIGQELVIMSENGPEECIIDCEDTDSTKAFNLSREATIVGLTITGGTAGAIHIQNVEGFTVRNCVIHSNLMDDVNISGGGISASASSGLIEQCIFTDNEGVASGIGLFISDGQIEVNNCIFTGNIADRFGGGILITVNSNCQITNCIFNGNSAGIDGGGIAISQTCEALVAFCTFVNNEAGLNVDNGMGGGFYKGSNSNPEIINCIFWGNEADIGNQIYAQDNGGEITINYCDVEGGVNEEDLWDGEEIMDEDPLLCEGREPDWGLDGYFLDADGPCIDAGSDTADELGMNEFTTQGDLSPDEDDADLGYHYDLSFFQATGSIEGYVRCVETGDAIEGAVITTSNNETAETNEWGYWLIEVVSAEREFDITASAAGYNDSTLVDQIIEEDEELEINFGLLHPVFSINPEEFTSEITQGDSLSYELTISNNGNGPLDWSVEKHPPGDQGYEAWELRRSYNVSEITEDSRLEGAMFNGEYFYVCGANQTGNDDGENLIYAIDRDGALVDTFEQIGNARNGMKDLAWDGELIWGSGERNVYAFTTEGNPANQWIGPFNSNQALAWDSDNELLWISSITGNNISGYDREGNLISEISRHDLRVYGLAYWPNDPDGYPLYVLHSEGGSGQSVSKIDPGENEVINIGNIGDENDRPGGTFISNLFDGYSWVFMNLANAGSDDRLDLWHLSTNLSWVQIEPVEGTIIPDDSQEIAVDFDVADFQPDTLECDIVFTHISGETIVHVTIIIQVNTIGSQPAITPVNFAITDVYPNPFNSTAVIKYSLPADTWVTVKLYDINGREVSTLIQQHQSMGSHNISLDGSILPAGVYLCKLEAFEKSSIRKIILVK